MAQQIEVRRRERPASRAGLRPASPADDEFLLRAHRQRTQQHAVDERDHREGARQPNRQREHRGGGESRAPRQGAHGVSRVLHELADVVRPRHASPPLVVDRHALPPRGRVVSEPFVRHLQRPLARLSARDQLLHPHLQVKRELLLDVPLRIEAEQPANAEAAMAGPRYPAGRRQRRGHGRRIAEPVVGLHAQPSASPGRKGIELGLAVVVGRPPRRGHPAPGLEPMQRRVERPLADRQDVLGGLLDPPGDVVAVGAAVAERLKDQEVERAPQNVGPGGLRSVFHRISMGAYSSSHRKAMGARRLAQSCDQGSTYIASLCITLLRMEMSKDLVAASATPLVLAILAEGDSYGYAIVKRVSELSHGRLHWTDGMLYPVLHRLERHGYVSANWGTSKTGRKHKYLPDHKSRPGAAYRPTGTVEGG